MRPLHIASKNGQKSIVKYILKRTQNQEETLKEDLSFLQSSFLHLTAYKGKFELAKFFIEKDVSLLKQNKNGDTVFHIACRHNQTAYVGAMINLMLNSNEKLKEIKSLDIENYTEKLTPY